MKDLKVMQQKMALFRKHGCANAHNSKSRTGSGNEDTVVL